jgi:hypothetical protein
MRNKLRMLMRKIKNAVEERNESNNARFNTENSSNDEQGKPDLLEPDQVYKYYYIYKYYHY